VGSLDGGHARRALTQGSYTHIGVSGIVELRRKSRESRLVISRSPIFRSVKREFHKVLLWVQISRKGIEEPIESSLGQGRRMILCMWTFSLQVGRAVSGVVSKLDSCLYISNRRGHEESQPCRRGEATDKHPIRKRKGRCPEEGAGRCRIQKWKEICMTFVPDSWTWK